jgi:hypothetical protein
MELVLNNLTGRFSERLSNEVTGANMLKGYIQPSDH